MYKLVHKEKKLYDCHYIFRLHNKDNFLQYFPCTFTAIFNVQNKKI